MSLSSFSYINIQSGEQKIMKYKSEEPAYVEFIRAVGNDTGTGMLQRVCVMLRINVSGSKITLSFHMLKTSNILTMVT